MAARPEVTSKKPGRRLLDFQALRERGIPCSRVHLARLEAAGKFPLHIEVGENSIAWFVDEIDDFLELKASERDAKAAALAAKADSSTTDSDCDGPLGVARKRQKPIATASSSASGRPEHT
jgi:predicted DNA-binding transcriptional regulator AlpA